MNVSFDEAQLKALMEKAVSNLRLNSLRGDTVTALTRELFTLMTPQRPEFKAGDLIFWRHKYNSDQYPYPEGKVLYWNESQTRIKIQYKNTLFDNPIGDSVEVWVYPAELASREEGQRAEKPVKPKESKAS